MLISLKMVTTLYLGDKTWYHNLHRNCECISNIRLATIPHIYIYKLISIIFANARLSTFVYIYIYLQLLLNEFYDKILNFM